MVYVLVPCHNNRRDVLELLTCLEHQTQKDMTVVLVDDGSTDGTDTSASAMSPNIVVLKGDGTLWWTGANELGLQYILSRARPEDFVLLLNNDVVVEQDYVQKLVETSVAHDRAIVGSTLVDIGNADHVEGGIRVDSWLHLHVNRDKETIENEECDTRIDVLSGRGTLVPSEVFRHIGGFDRKKLPHYGADYEFSIRAKEAGHRLVLSHRAKVHAKLDITGLVAPQHRPLSFRECWALLFSTKSKTNILYYSNYVWLCSKRGFKLRNLLTAIRGILSGTVFSTRPGAMLALVSWSIGGVFVLVPKIMFRAMVKVYSFLVMDYPFMSSDIAKVGLLPEQLMRKGVVEETTFLGYRFFRLRRGVLVTCQDLSEYSPDERSKIEYLRRRSFNYLHKAQIDFQKIRILASRRSESHEH